MTHSHRDITELLAAHGLAPRRAFGQNFVSDPNTVRRIARMANVNATDHVVEIGAGLGSLTLALAETGARITAIEIDHGIAPVLRDIVKDLPNVSVVVGDALELDWNEIIPPGSSAVVVANLPYNVATPLVADLLDAIPQISRFVVMVQKEVALRLASSVGSSDYGAISVKVAYWATARVLGDVPPSVFIPRPKVTSSIIEITRRETPAVGPHIAPQQLFKVIRTGFGQRRKMLRRSLAAIATPENFANADVSPEARPGELNVEQWGRLATEIQKNHRP
ncbi:MAG: 16S rRNA (adenine(1518)-N(6)/adenine(1519)-N(6))-dimethyltransferase RsmA [Actinomycetota bacterium]|nr:16S rRNA (adenine(1518)-N(6)/adenine(1519)-N(6))-dimethyltransferase RsmA [Actinomycetota bacterium]MDA3019860.1 16S rRNA (adenine(1518)-N(6)/adenine(1519)-N(6))-dimethyltransferase RsmA [Actinomycetota bacterium]